MSTRLTAIAVAALLALGTGSVVAATADTPRADTSNDALPANYTVEVVSGDPADDTLDRAIRTVWANDTVRGHFEDGDPVHFEVRSSSRNDSIHVTLASGERPDETRVVAAVDSDRWTVTSVSEFITLAATNVTELNGSDLEVTVTSARADGDGDRNATRLTADQSQQFRIVESTTDRENGITVFEASTDGTESSSTTVTDDGA
jgi:hypothetical protein